MDSEKLSKQYIENYNKLTDLYNNSEIKSIVAAINEAIYYADKPKIEACYLKIQSWNSDIADMEENRNSLNHKFRHLHLPSVEMLTIVYDNIVKCWKFNADAD